MTSTNEQTHQANNAEGSAAVQPSQLNGQATSALGVVQQAIGSVIPESLGSNSWTQSGNELYEKGQREVDEAKREKAVDATVDSAFAKGKSALGYITGDQEKQLQGNEQAEKAQWDYKQATSSKPLDIPIPSTQGLQGKLQSVQGYLTGDAELQKEGNVKAEKAAWTDGV